MASFAPGIFMVNKILIIAAHSASLTPVWGEPALCRLARLAGSLVDEVELWITPEIHGGLGRAARRLPARVSQKILPRDDMLNAARQLDWAPGEKILVLPGNSLWDRFSLNRVLRALQVGKAERMDGLVVSGPVELTAALEICSSNRRLPLFFSSPPLPWLLGDKADAAEAESRLVQNLAAATLASDGLLARLVDRRISRRLSPTLARQGIPPNAITLFSTSIGLIGAWLLAQTGYCQHLLGALLFWAAVVLDGVDGEVARLTLKESRFGHYLDIITDNLVHVAVFIGIALGLYRGTGNIWHLYALGALLLGFDGCALVIWHVMDHGTGLRENQASAVSARLVAALNSRDFAYLVVILALIDRLSWFLGGAAVGTYIFALAVWLLSRGRPGGGTFP
uniref:CDP-alcohol phosphatidyltransferase family protein n=1 Tax=Desulfobacca acetoxidans TaxID=60893 RepID=A0A7C3WSH6_9BACT